MVITQEQFNRAMKEVNQAFAKQDKEIATLKAALEELKEAAPAAKPKPAARSKTAAKAS